MERPRGTDEQNTGPGAPPIQILYSGLSPSGENPVPEEENLIRSDLRHTFISGTSAAEIKNQQDDEANQCLAECSNSITHFLTVCSGRTASCIQAICTPVGYCLQGTWNALGSCLQFTKRQGLVFLSWNKRGLIQGVDFGSSKYPFGGYVSTALLTNALGTLYVANYDPFHFAERFIIFYNPVGKFLIINGVIIATWGIKNIAESLWYGPMRRSLLPEDDSVIKRITGDGLDITLRDHPVLDPGSVEEDAKQACSVSRLPILERMGGAFLFQSLGTQIGYAFPEYGWVYGLIAGNIVAILGVANTINIAMTGPQQLLGGWLGRDFCLEDGFLVPAFYAPKSSISKITGLLINGSLSAVFLIQKTLPIVYLVPTVGGLVVINFIGLHHIGDFFSVALRLYIWGAFGPNCYLEESAFEAAENAAKSSLVKGLVIVTLAGLSFGVPFLAGQSVQLAGLISAATVTPALLGGYHFVNIMSLVGKILKYGSLGNRWGIEDEALENKLSILLGNLVVQIISHSIIALPIFLQTNAIARPFTLTFIGTNLLTIPGLLRLGKLVLNMGDGLLFIGKQFFEGMKKFINWHIEGLKGIDPQNILQTLGGVAFSLEAGGIGALIAYLCKAGMIKALKISAHIFTPLMIGSSFGWSETLLSLANGQFNWPEGFLAPSEPSQFRAIPVEEEDKSEGKIGAFPNIMVPTYDWEEPSSAESRGGQEKEVIGHAILFREEDLSPASDYQTTIEEEQIPRKESDDSLVEEHLPVAENHQPGFSYSRLSGPLLSICLGTQIGSIFPDFSYLIGGSIGLTVGILGGYNLINLIVNLPRTLILGIVPKRNMPSGVLPEDNYGYKSNQGRMVNYVALNVTSAITALIVNLKERQSEWVSLLPLATIIISIPGIYHLTDGLLSCMKWLARDSWEGIAFTNKKHMPFGGLLLSVGAGITVGIVEKSFLMGLGVGWGMLPIGAFGLKSVLQTIWTGPLEKPLPESRIPFKFKHEEDEKFSFDLAPRPGEEEEAERELEVEERAPVNFACSGHGCHRFATFPLLIGLPFVITSHLGLNINYVGMATGTGAAISLLGLGNIIGIVESGVRVLWGGCFGPAFRFTDGFLGSALCAYKTIPGKLTGWISANTLPVLIAYAAGERNTSLIIVGMSSLITSTIGLHHILNFLTIVLGRLPVGGIGGCEFNLEGSSFGPATYAVNSTPMKIIGLAIWVGATFETALATGSSYQWAGILSAITITTAGFGLHHIVNVLSLVVKTLYKGSSGDGCGVENALQNKLSRFIGVLATLGISNTAIALPVILLAKANIAITVGLTSTGTILIAIPGLKRISSLLIASGSTLLSGVAGGSFGSDFQIPDSILGAAQYANESTFARIGVPCVAGAAAAGIALGCNAPLLIIAISAGAATGVTITGLHHLFDIVAQTLSTLYHGITCKFDSSSQRDQGRGFGKPKTIVGGVLWPIATAGGMATGLAFTNPFLTPISVLPFIGAKTLCDSDRCKQVGMISVFGPIAVVIRQPLKAIFVNVKAGYNIARFIGGTPRKPVTSLVRLGVNVGVTVATHQVIDKIMDAWLPDLSAATRVSIKATWVTVVFTLTSSISKWATNCARKWYYGHKNPERYSLDTAQIASIKHNLKSVVILEDEKRGEQQLENMIDLTNRAFEKTIDHVKHQSLTYRFSRVFYYGPPEKYLKTAHDLFKTGHALWEIWDDTLGQNPPGSLIDSNLQLFLDKKGDGTPIIHYPLTQLPNSVQSNKHQAVGVTWES